MRERPEITGGVLDRRQRGRGYTEDLEQTLVELGCTELSPRRRRRVRREARAEAVAEERIHRAEPPGPRLDRPRHRLVVLEQPSELPGGEVRIERHPAALGHLGGGALGLEALEDLLG